MQKSTSNRIVVMLVALVMGVWQALAQEPERLEAVLRFDRAQRDTVAEATAAALPAVADTSSRIACKLNRRRTGFVEAYDAVTLWNVRRVKVKPRRMRLSDTTGREQVRLLKFFTERNRRKGVRPHLVGNAAGYTWTGGGESPDPRTGEWRTEPSRINTYSLRADYDSLRRVEGYVQVSWKPEGIWRGLPEDALYLLDGRPVPGSVLRFIEGLTLRRLDIWNPADGVEAAARAAGVLDSLGEAFQPAVGAAPRAAGCFGRSFLDDRRVAGDVSVQCLFDECERPDALLLYFAGRSRAALRTAGPLRSRLHRPGGVSGGWEL